MTDTTTTYINIVNLWKNKIYIIFFYNYTNNRGDK